MIAKQDRQGVRKASDIEQKYDLGSSENAMAVAANAQRTATAARDTANSAAATATKAMQMIEDITPGAGGGLAPQMFIYTIEGTSVTCTRNGVAIEGKQYGAVWVFDLPSYGYYIFTYRDGSIENTEGLYVDTVKEYRKMFKSGYGYYTASTEYLLGVDWTDAQNKSEEFYTRDPFVMLCDDVYFMYSSNMISPEIGNKGFSCRISSDKENWSNIYDITAGAIDWTGYENFWSPEIIYRNGWFYMVVSCRKTGTEGNGLMILASQSPFGKFYNITENGWLTDIENENCVEPNLWCDTNINVFYTESNNHYDPEKSKPDVIYTRVLNSGATAFDAGAYKVLRANEVPWATSDVCSGAFVLPDTIDGKVVMLFYADSANGRAIGQARATGIGGNYLDPDGTGGVWEVNPNPLLTGDVGQPSVFTDRRGKMMLAYHKPNTADYDNGIIEHAEFAELTVENGWLRIKT